MKSALSIASFLLILALLASYRSLLAQNTEELLDFSVEAKCESHSEIGTPEKIGVRFVHQTTAEGLPSFEAFLSTDKPEEMSSIKNSFGFPEKSWISALFAGPPVEAAFYCQPASHPKDLFFIYYPIKGGKVFLSQNEEFSSNELDLIGSPGKDFLQVNSQGEFKNEYKAGKDSINPYWLQFSVPLHSRDDLTTVIRYRFP